MGGQILMPPFHRAAAAALLAIAAIFSSPPAAAGEAGFTGMQVQGITPEIAAALGLKSQKGVLVRDVALGGPADRAGFRRFDLILKFAGQDIDTFERLIAAVRTVEAGQKVAVTVLRRGAPVELTLEAGKRPRSRSIKKGSFATIPAAGLTLAALTEKVRKSFGLRWSSVGVVVTLVDKTKAAGSDLKRGEIIVKVDQDDVWDPRQVAAKYGEAKAKGRKSLLLLVEGYQGARNGFHFSLLPVK